jgi:hypothetical protein
MVLSGDEHFPLVDRRNRKEGPGIADEVAENVLFQLRLAVGRVNAAQGIQAGEQRPCGDGRAVVDSGVAAPARRGVRARRGDFGDQIGETVYRDGCNGHA